MSGIIYLVQPSELVGTKRYKIGCSTKPTLDRVKNGYKKGTRYLHIAECNEPYKIEGEIKKIFDNKFILIAGNEYYEGDESMMKQEFINLIMKRHQIERHEYSHRKSIDGNPTDGYECFSEEKAELMTLLLQKKKSEFISLNKKYNDDNSYGVNIIDDNLIDKIINCDFLKGINHLYIDHGTLHIQLNNTDVSYINNNTNINIIKQIWNNIKGNSDGHDMKIYKT